MQDWAADCVGQQASIPSFLPVQLVNMELAFLPAQLVNPRLDFLPEQLVNLRLEFLAALTVQLMSPSSLGQLGLVQLGPVQLGSISSYHSCIFVQPGLVHL